MKTREPNARQHMIRKARRSYCGLPMVFKHLIYTPRNKESIKAMRKKRVCITCIAASDKEYEYTD